MITFISKDNILTFRITFHVEMTELRCYLNGNRANLPDENMEICRHGDMKTWRQADMEKCRHADMETWRYADMET